MPSSFESTYTERCNGSRPLAHPNYSVIGVGLAETAAMTDTLQLPTRPFDRSREQGLYEVYIEKPKVSSAGALDKHLNYAITVDA